MPCTVLHIVQQLMHLSSITLIYIFEAVNPANAIQWKMVFTQMPNSMCILRPEEIVRKWAHNNACNARTSILFFVCSSLISRNFINIIYTAKENILTKQTMNTREVQLNERARKRESNVYK